MVYARFEFNSSCFVLSFWILLLLTACCSLPFVVLLRLPSSTVLYFILFLAFHIWFPFNCRSTELNIHWWKRWQIRDEKTWTLCAFISFILFRIRFVFGISFRPWSLWSLLYAFFIWRERESNSLYAAVSFYNCIHIQYVWIQHSHTHVFPIFVAFGLWRYHIVSHKGSNVLLLLLLLLRSYTFVQFMHRRNSLCRRYVSCVLYNILWVCFWAAGTHLRLYQCNVFDLESECVFFLSLLVFRFAFMCVIVWLCRFVSFRFVSSR